MSVAWNDDVTLTVELGFGYGVYDDPSWTDITAYVRGFTVRRGRDFAGDATNPGVGTMTLDNTDGRFDPTYTGGAYYPDIFPMVQIRIRAAYDITGALELDHGTHGQLGDPLQLGTVDVWRGYITDWPQEWPGNLDATVDAVLVDGHKLLNLDYVDTATTGIVPQFLGVEPTGKRIDHLLDSTGWPAAWRHIPVGDVEQPGKNYTETVLSAIRGAVDIEQGLGHITPSGVYELQPASYRAAQTSQLTFGDDTGEAPYTSLRFGYGDDQIWNYADVTTTPDDRALSRVTASMTKYGTRVQRYVASAPGEGNADFDGATSASTRAAAVTDQYAYPHLAVSELTFLPQTDPTVLWPAAFGFDVGTLLLTNRRPPAGNTISIARWVEAISHEVDAAEGLWKTTFTLSEYEQ